MSTGLYASFAYPMRIMAPSLSELHRRPPEMAVQNVRFCWKQTVLPFFFVLLVPFAACGGEAEDPGVPTVIEGVEVERVGPYDHPLGPLAYDEPMPSGGDHPPAPYWLTCGVYDGEVPPELALHSVEHGAVWIGLGPDSTPEDREAATGLAEDRKVIVSDVPGLEAPVELVSWGRRLSLDAADDPRAGRFVDTFVDGDNAPEAGSSCESVGVPPEPPELPTS
jgi:hypothetical protein